MIVRDFLDVLNIEQVLVFTTDNVFDGEQPFLKIKCGDVNSIGEFDWLRKKEINAITMLTKYEQVYPEIDIDLD